MHYTIRHKMCIIKILLVCFYLLAILAANAHAQKKLGFASANSSFKIAIFADLHYGENAWSDWGPQHDQLSSKVMSTVLDSEKPDFVVYLGDVITANNLAVKNATKYWEQAISPTKSRNIPWASVFGNHDDAAFEWPAEWFGSLGLPSIKCPDSALATGVEQMDCNFQGTSRVDIMEMDSQQPLSHSLNGPKSLWPSVSNYVLEIASYKDSESPAALLYFLDSGGGSYTGVISDKQAKWFQQTAVQKNPDSRIPEIVFWHIPSIAYKDIAPPVDTIKDPCVGSINAEIAGTQTNESGIMDIFTSRTSVKAIFAGHDHGLDWCCPSKNLWLCFARHTGYGGYQRPEGAGKGAKIVELVEANSEIKSWIRMEDGTTHSLLTIASA